MVMGEEPENNQVIELMDEDKVANKSPEQPRRKVTKSGTEVGKRQGRTLLEKLKKKLNKVEQQEVKTQGRAISYMYGNQSNYSQDHI